MDTNSLKQETLLRIKKIEDSYLTKQDALDLRQDIVDSDSVAKTDIILVNEGEIKFFETDEAFNAFKKNIKTNYSIELNENVDYIVIEEDYYLKTSVSSGGYKAGSNLISVSNLPTDTFNLRSFQNIGALQSDKPYGEAEVSLNYKTWNRTYGGGWYGIKGDSADSIICFFWGSIFLSDDKNTSIYYRDGNAASNRNVKNVPMWIRLNTNTQTEFLPKYLNIYVVKFLKTLTYKTFLINTNKEQISEFKEIYKGVAEILLAYQKEKEKPELTYVKGQQYTFINQEAFNDILSKLVVIPDNDLSNKTPATSDNVEITNSTVEGNETIVVIPKINLYYMGG